MRTTTASKIAWTVFVVALVPAFIGDGWAIAHHRERVRMLVASGVNEVSVEWYTTHARICMAAIVIGSTIAAMFMSIAAIVALVIRVRAKAPSPLLPASVASFVAFAASAVRAYGERRSLGELDGWLPTRLAALKRWMLVMTAAEITLAITVVTLIAFVVWVARTSRKSSAACACAFALTALAIAAPRVFARSADAPFGLGPAEENHIACVQSEEHWDWGVPGGTLYFMRSTGEHFPIDKPLNEPTKLFADHDVTYAMLQTFGADSRYGVTSLELQIAPKAVPTDLSRFGALGAYLVHETWPARFVLTSSAAPSSSALVLLDADAARAITPSGSVIVLPLGDDDASVRMRRNFFASVPGLANQPLYIAPRPEDRVETIWRVASDAFAAAGWSVQVNLTPARERAKSWSTFDNVW